MKEVARPPIMEKLRNAREYRRILDHGRSYVDSLLVVYALPPEGRNGRIGVIVSRKFGGAVARNRIRRRVLEAFRQGLGAPDMCKDIVVIPRKAVKGVGYEELCGALQRLLLAARALPGSKEASRGAD